MCCFTHEHHFGSITRQIFQIWPAYEDVRSKGLRKAKQFTDSVAHDERDVYVNLI